MRATPVVGAKLLAGVHPARHAAAEHAPARRPRLLLLYSTQLHVACVTEPLTPPSKAQHGLLRACIAGHTIWLVIVTLQITEFSAQAAASGVWRRKHHY
jgi:hypothetical protein